MRGVAKKSLSLRELHRLAREKLGERAGALKTREELVLALEALGPLPAPRMSAPRAPRLSAPRSPRASATRPKPQPDPKPALAAEPPPPPKPHFEPKRALAADPAPLVLRDFFLEPPGK